ncbi:MAG: hypothetical protein V8T30_09280 [Ruminococcus sp.]
MNQVIMSASSVSFFVLSANAVLADTASIALTANAVAATESTFFR